jgi:nucleoside-diphosphate-sugar epimerase
MTLVSGGSGICWHIYIDNLIDAIVLAAVHPKAPGEIFAVSDDKHDTTWKVYFNRLAEVAGYPPIKRNIPKWAALGAAYCMSLSPSVFKQKPLWTAMAVNIVTSRNTLSVEKAKRVLGYKPRVPFEEGMARVGQWLRESGYCN